MVLPALSKNCEICNKTFRVWPSVFHRQKYCSRHCQGVAVARKAHQARLDRIQQIQAGANLPMPRRNRKSKHFPPDTAYVDELADPDEPKPEEQDEINKQINQLHQDRLTRDNKLETSFHKKKKQ